MKTAVFLLGQAALANAFVVPRAGIVGISSTSISAKKQSDEIPTEEVDVVVIGSGLAGLSCAALLSHCDKKTVVLEAHDTPGGAVRFVVEFSFTILETLSNQNFIHNTINFRFMHCLELRSFLDEFRLTDGSDEAFILSLVHPCILDSARTNLRIRSRMSFRLLGRMPNGSPTIDGELSCPMDENLLPRLAPRNSVTS